MQDLTPFTAFGATSAQSFTATTDSNGIATLTIPVFAAGFLEPMTAGRYFSVPVNIIAQIQAQPLSMVSFIQSVFQLPASGVNCPAIAVTVSSLSAETVSTSPPDLRILPAVSVLQSLPGDPPLPLPPQIIDLTYIFINDILVEYSYLGNNIFRVTGSMPAFPKNFSVRREWPDCTRRFNSVVRQALSPSHAVAVDVLSATSLSLLSIAFGAFGSRRIAAQLKAKAL